jgi:transcriptional regulator with XRE-family HTH domain
MSDSDTSRKNIAKNFKNLRKILQLSQKQVALRGGISEGDVSKLECGRLLLRTAPARRAFARGFGLTVRVIDALVEGEISAQQAAEVAQLSPGTLALSLSGKSPTDQGEALATLTRLAHLEGARFPNLELALMYHAANGKRWPEETVSAARSGDFVKDDRTPRDWEVILDRLQKVRDEVTAPTQTIPEDELTQRKA